MPEDKKGEIEIKITTQGADKVATVWVNQAADSLGKGYETRDHYMLKAKDSKVPENIDYIATHFEYVSNKQVGGRPPQDFATAEDLTKMLETTVLNSSKTKTVNISINGKAASFKQMDELLEKSEKVHEILKDPLIEHPGLKKMLEEQDPATIDPRDMAVNFKKAKTGLEI